MKRWEIFLKKIPYLCRTKKDDIMDNNIKLRIDEILEEICKINDLNAKADILTYMERQAAFQLWQLEEDLRVDHNMKDF